MSVTFHSGSHRLLVTIDQPVFEATHAAELASELNSFSTEPVETIDLDFGQVEQIDSIAIQTLIGLRGTFAKLTEPPAFSFSNPSPPVRQIIGLLGLERLCRVAQ